MPVKYYTSKNFLSKENPPMYSHETSSIIDIIKDIYSCYNHHDSLYFIIANLNIKNAPADLLVLTERGIGVIELKDYPGVISQKLSKWYAGVQPIKFSSRYNNPHEQVQGYAKEIRDKLTQELKKYPFMKFKFNTAVCFTNPMADFDAFKTIYNATTETWERFKILKPSDIPDWVAGLNFEEEKKIGHQFEPYLINDSDMIYIVEELFKAVEWKQLKKLVPTEQKPYASFSLIEQGNETMNYSLCHDKILIGRSTECEICIPPKYKQISRKHALINRYIKGIFIEDLNSSNGTFVNGKKIDLPLKLKDEEKISLGGPPYAKNVCLLKFFQKKVEDEETEILDFNDEHKSEMIGRYKIQNEIDCFDYSFSRCQTFKALDSSTDRTVLIKQYHFSPFLNKDKYNNYKKLIQDGIHISNKVRKIIATPEIYGHMIYGDRLWIAIEWIESISLQEYMDKHPKPKQAQIKSYIKKIINICELLIFLHQQDIDFSFSSENIIIPSDNRCPLMFINFESDKLKAIDSENSKIFNPVNFIGVLLYEFISNKNYDDTNNKPLHKLNTQIHKSFSRIIQKCLSNNSYNLEELIDQLQAAISNKKIFKQQ